MFFIHKRKMYPDDRIMYIIKNLEDATMGYHDKLKADIERLRSVMHRLAGEGADYSKILAASQELDILIVKYYKFTMSVILNTPPLAMPACSGLIKA
jgi:hypothetical protein